MTPYTDLQLDALRELANIGSGTAAAALSQMLGRPVDIDVPLAAAMALEEAVALAGDAEEERYGILVPIRGDLEGDVVMLVPAQDAVLLCGVFGLDPDTEDGHSALGEFGNILGASYVNALGAMAGMEMEPDPPQVVHDMLAAILTTVLLGRGEVDQVLVLDSALSVEGEDCSLSFMLLPARGGIDDLLGRLGVG